MRRRWWWLAGLAIAVLVVVVLAPLASSAPDGLERVAEDGGFVGQAQAAVYELLPDYSVPGIEAEGVGRVVSGLVGVGLVFALMWGLGALLARRRGRPGRDPG